MTQTLILLRENSHVYFQHHCPFDKVDGLPQDVIDSGVLVETSTIPETPNEVGFTFELYYNTETSEFYFEKRAIPLNQEQELSILKQTVADMEFALMMGGII